jgi:polyisoprenyl-phosphate glycosyltransferase
VSEERAMPQAETTETTQTRGATRLGIGVDPRPMFSDFAIPRQSSTPRLLSVVAPCHNEERCLRELHRRVSAAAEAVAGDNYELLLLNDGSTDATWSLMCQIAAEETRVVAVNLSRRHGHQLALTAGLHLCHGEVILIIDADLQDPPELLPEMWKRMIETGADVVYGRRRERRGEGAVKRTTAALFYRVMRRIMGADFPVDTGDFRLMKRRVLDALNSMPEQHRFIRGMVSWIGMRQVEFLYDRDPRFAGPTQYPMRRMIGFALDAITSFSIFPLRIASAIGALGGIISLMMLTYTLGGYAFGRVVEGWTSLATIVLLLGSTQLLLFGIMGEYLGRLYLESKRRPLFIIDQIFSSNTAIDPPLPHSDSSRSTPGSEKIAAP